MPEFDIGHSNALNRNSVPVEDHSGKEDDDGYLGGQEWDDESCGVLSPVYEGAGYENNVCEGFDTGNGLDIESDSDGDPGTGGDGHPKESAVHLGDCGCLTGEEHDDICDGGDGLSSEDSDSMPVRFGGLLC